MYLPYEKDDNVLGAFDPNSGGAGTAPTTTPGSTPRYPNQPTGSGDSGWIGWVKRTVGDILTDLWHGLLGIFDPGVKRDKEREARAEIWYRLANEGKSVTAARYLYGGTSIPYTGKERGFYQQRWDRFKVENPSIAQAAVSMGPLASVDFEVTNAAIEQIQKEVEESHGVIPGGTIPTGGTQQAGAGDYTPLIVLGILGAILYARRKRG